MTPNRLLLSEHHVDAIQSQMRSRPHEEICGFLAGVGGTVAAVYPVANISEMPHVRFRMDPQGQVRALVDIRRQGWEVIAIYHSHPARSQSSPSSIDIGEYQYPGSWIVIVLPDVNGSILSLNAYRIQGSKVKQVDVVVGE